LQSTHPDFFYAFFGILLAGGIPVLLAPVFTLDQAKNIISILRDAEVRSFITPLATKKYALLLRPFISNLKSVTTVTELLHQGKTVLPHHVKGHHPALIQYTTHPANPPVACLLRHEDLLANIRVEKVADTASCHANLIYQWLTCFYHGAPLVLKTTLEKHEFATESQMRKLRWRSGWQRVCNGVVTFAEVIYTAYLTIISLLTMLPILLYVSVSSRDRAAYAACLWAKIILLLSFCPVTIIGREKLYKKIPMVYVANHASYIDSIIMMAILPVSTRIIFKKELIHHPFIRFIMKKIDYLPVDRLDYIQGIEDTQRFVSTLKAKHSVMIFPEGTFGYVTGLRPFKLGAFKIAAETATPVCSIALKGTRRIWRDVESLLRPGRITVTVCDPIMPTGDDWKAVTALRQKVKTEIVKYCGEPALDWMIAQPIAPRHRKNEC
jgi:1-acyl-sn-glycerol-3-phosphate acyltransferase